MQKVIQLSENQYDLLSSDLAELIGKLDNKDKKGLIQKIEAIINKVENIDDSYITQIRKLQENYSELESKLQKHQIENVGLEFENLKKSFVNDIKNFNYKQIVTEHGSTMAAAFEKSLTENKNYVDFTNNLNNINSELLENQKQDLIRTMETLNKFIEALNLSVNTIEEKQRRDERINTNFEKFDSKLVSIVSVKVTLFNWGFGVICGVVGMMIYSKVFG